MNLVSNINTGTGAIGIKQRLVNILKLIYLDELLSGLVNILNGGKTMKTTKREKARALPTVRKDLVERHCLTYSEHRRACAFLGVKPRNFISFLFWRMRKKRSDNNAE